MRRVLIALVLCLLLSGCGTIHTRYTNRMVLVHKDGYAMDTRRERILEFDSPNQIEKFRGTTWAHDILQGVDDEAERRSREGRVLKLLVYVHGGLNTYSKEMVRTAKLVEAARTGTIGGDGDGRGDRKVPHLAAYYPLFINWNSDLLESVWDDLFEIQSGERRPYYGYLAAAPAVAARLASGVEHLPTSIGLDARGRQGAKKRGNCSSER